LRALTTAPLILAAAMVSGRATVPQTLVALGLAASSQGRHPAAIELMQSAAIGPGGAIRDQVAFQHWTQMLPFMTNELEPAALDRGRSFGDPDPAWARRIAVAMQRDALAGIGRRARATSIVILNEAHYSPRDRAFALQVASEKLTMVATPLSR